MNPPICGKLKAEVGGAQETGEDWAMGWVVRTFISIPIACIALIGCETARPITKIEARTLDAEAVTRRVSVQLAEVLKLMPREPTRVRPKRVLEDLWFWTVPRATAIPGLCQADEVVMRFAPGDVETFDADTPTRVHGIEARPHFHFLAPSQPSVWTERTRTEAKAADAACGRLDPNTDGFFEAEDEEYANRSALLLNKVLEQIRSGQPHFELVCTNSDGPCADLFGGLDLEDLSAVRRCGRNEDVFNTTCTQFRLGSLRIDVIWPYADEPDTITRVTVAELVVLVHERID